MGGYSFDHGEDILAPLHAVMQERGVQTDLFLNIEASKTRESDLRAYCTLVVDRFLASNWPFGDPKPVIYFDPRTASTAVYSSLHAKCVIVDGRFSLITSANFTARAQQRNIEAGVLIDDTSFAARFAAHWRGLVSHGLVARYGASNQDG